MKEECAGEVLQQLVNEWNVILTHINTKRIQAQEFEKDKKRENARVLQIDFAMNYSCECQTEKKQSALWSRASVTLFTAAAITKDSGQSFLICSDTKDKDKDTIAAFIFALYENHLFPSDQVDEEIIWSDGPTTGIQEQVHNEAPSPIVVPVPETVFLEVLRYVHGKGVVDGTGGRAKSLVRQKVMSQSSEPTIVQSAKDFSQTARILMPKTTVLYIPESETHREKETRKLWKENLPAIPGIISGLTLKITSFIDTKMSSRNFQPLPLLEIEDNLPLKN